MNKENLSELGNCLIKANNPIIDYLNTGVSYNEEIFANELSLLNFELSQDLNDFYCWKSGLKKELSESWDFKYKLSTYGSNIEYPEVISNYKILAERDRELFKNKFVPFILDNILGFEDPILIDLSKKSKTYGAIFFFSTATGLFDKPIQIYDSLDAMVETMIECYQRGVYTISKDGILLSDGEKEIAISEKVNKKSEYWKYCH